MQAKRNEYVRDRRTCDEHRFNRSFLERIQKSLDTLHEPFIGIDTQQKIERKYNHALLTAAIQKLFPALMNIHSTRTNHFHFFFL